jgi:hypothetical protein
MPARLRPSLAWQTIAGEGVVVDLERRKMLGLNPTGALIWSLLETHEPAAIVEEVARRFDVDKETAGRDVAAFLDELRTRGLTVEA